MVSGKKALKSAFSIFMKRGQFALAEKLGMLVMMHLPRARPYAGRPQRLPSRREIRTNFQSLNCVSRILDAVLTPYHFSQAIEKMGEDIHWPCILIRRRCFNPEVYELALNTVPRTYPLWDGRNRSSYGTENGHGQRQVTKTLHAKFCVEHA